MDQAVIDRIYMLGANREKETAVYFSRPEQKNSSQIRMGRKGSVNALESKAVAAVNNFRINTADIPEKVEIKYGAEGYFVNVRRGAATFIMLPKAGEKDVEVGNPEGWMPEGEYTDMVGGGKFTVSGTGISGRVGPEGVAVLYADGFNSVDAITPEAPSQTYFLDLTGRRVDNPGKGFYIRVEDGRATKVRL